MDMTSEILLRQTIQMQKNEIEQLNLKLKQKNARLKTMSRDLKAARSKIQRLKDAKNKLLAKFKQTTRPEKTAPQSSNFYREQAKPCFSLFFSQSKT